MRGVGYAGVDWALRSVWNRQGELGHCERCGICRRMQDIARGVEYAAWDVRHCERWEHA